MGQINILSTDGTHKAGLSFTGTNDIVLAADIKSARERQEEYELSNTLGE